MRSGKEIVLEYCANIETHDVDHLVSCLDNEKDIKSGEYLKDGYELSGCPASYGLDGLDELNELCFKEETKNFKEQYEQCRKCWIQALESNFNR